MKTYIQLLLPYACLNNGKPGLQTKLSVMAPNVWISLEFRIFIEYTERERHLLHKIYSFDQTKKYKSEKHTSSVHRAIYHIKTRLTERRWRFAVQKKLFWCSPLPLIFFCCRIINEITHSAYNSRDKWKILTAFDWFAPIASTRYFFALKTFSIRYFQ